MEKTKQYVTPYEFEGRLPLKQAIPLGLQHVLAMFVGNLTPILIITNLCAARRRRGGLRRHPGGVAAKRHAGGGHRHPGAAVLRGPCGRQGTHHHGHQLRLHRRVPERGQGHGRRHCCPTAAIMGASILGGLFETVLGAFLKPLRRFFPAVVTGTVVLSIGLSLISVGVGSFGGGTSANGLRLAGEPAHRPCGHGHRAGPQARSQGLASSSCILIGIICGYVICGVLGLVLPTTGVTAEGVEYTKAWVLNWDKVAPGRLVRRAPADAGEAGV